MMKMFRHRHGIIWQNFKLLSKSVQLRMHCSHIVTLANAGIASWLLQHDTIKLRTTDGIRSKGQPAQHSEAEGS